MSQDRAKAAVAVAAGARAARQRRERFVSKRAQSAAGELWASQILKKGKPTWRTYALHLAGIQTPKCACMACAAEALTEPAQVEMLRHAKKAY